MVTREELNGKSQKEAQALLQQDLDIYKINVDEVNSEEELMKMEEDLMKEHDDFKEVLKSLKYSLNDEVLYDGELYKRSAIAEKTAYFLGKMEVEWSYTLGMYQLMQFWRKDFTEIPYEVFDSTLRILNQLKYKGYSEWRDILAINEFLSSCHLEYVRDTSYLIYISQKHNILIDRMKLVSPLPETVEETK